jgi:hypothetical protein
MARIQPVIIVKACTGSSNSIERFIRRKSECWYVIKCESDNIEAGARYWKKRNIVLSYSVKCSRAERSSWSEKRLLKNPFYTVNKAFLNSGRNTG